MKRLVVCKSVARLLLLALSSCTPALRSPRADTEELPVHRGAPAASATPPAEPEARPSASLASPSSVAGDTPVTPVLRPATGDSVDVPFVLESPTLPGERRDRPTGLVAGATADEALARWNFGGTGSSDHPSNRPGFHPGVRVVVDATPLRRIPKTSKNRRVLSEARLLARARSRGYWPLRVCFEDLLREQPDHPGGETRLRIGIAPAGTVYAARVTKSELEARSIRACLVSAVRALQFEPPPVRRLDVELRVELWPGDLPPPPLPRKVEEPGLDPKRVEPWLQAREPELRACCAAAVQRDPGLWGRIALRARFREQGMPGSVHEEASRFPDPEATACAIRALTSAPALDGAPPAGEFEVEFGMRCGRAPAPGPEVAAGVVPVSPNQPVVPPAPASTAGAPAEPVSPDIAPSPP